MYSLPASFFSSLSLLSTALTHAQYKLTFHLFFSLFHLLPSPPLFLLSSSSLPPLFSVPLLCPHFSSIVSGQIMISKLLYGDIVPLLSSFQKHEFKHFDIFSSFATDRNVSFQLSSFFYPYFFYLFFFFSFSFFFYLSSL